MILPFTIALTWLIIMCLYFVKKQLPFLINAIIYILLVIGLTNYTTIFSMNLHRFKTTDDPIFFIAFLLYREFIFPIIIIIFVNFFIKSNWKTKILSLFSAILAVEIIDVLMVKAKIVFYIHWSFAYEFLFNLVFLLFGFMLAKILLVINKKEEYKI